MLTLASKLKRDDGLRGSRTSAAASDSTRRVSVRDRLLVKGNVRVRRPPASQRGLAGGFWDAEWPVAEQKYLLGNILQHNARCLRREDLALCAGRGNARGEKRVLPWADRSLPARSLSLPRVAVGEQAPRGGPVAGLSAGWRWRGASCLLHSSAWGAGPCRKGLEFGILLGSFSVLFKSGSAADWPSAAGCGRGCVGRAGVCVQLCTHSLDTPQSPGAEAASWGASTTEVGKKQPLPRGSWCRAAPAARRVLPFLPWKEPGSTEAPSGRSGDTAGACGVRWPVRLAWQQGAGA